MPRAIWNGEVIAESDRFELVEGNVYFPPEAVKAGALRASTHTTICGWKGTAHYHDVMAGGQANPNAAWYYPEPKPAASNIKDYIAFWKGVTVER